MQMLNISDHNTLTDLVKYNAENIGNAIDRHSGSFDYAVFSLSPRDAQNQCGRPTLLRRLLHLFIGSELGCR